MKADAKTIMENAGRAAEELFGILRGADAARNESRIQRYVPREGHPDWDAVREKASLLASKALQVIETDAGTPNG